MRTVPLRPTTRTILSAMTVAGLMLIVGCAPSHMNASKDLVSVRVLPASEPVWTYTITTRNVENLVAVEFISSSDLSDVTVVPLPATWRLDKTRSANSIKIELNGNIFGTSATQFRSMKVMLKSKNKDLKNGDIQVRVTDFRGNITTINPIAGPV